ncbi:hypothetical protein IIA16_06270, partial [bacterium]|nr:hypothetical protein [bacterium]
MQSLPVALFLWRPKARLQAHLEAGLPGARCVFADGKEGEAVLALAAEAVAMVGWRATAELLDAAPRLRLFQCPGTGVRHLVGLFKGREAALCNGHGNAGFVAQHAVALLLAAANRLLPHHEEMRAGRWRDGGGPGDSLPLAGSVVGVAGTGAIGQSVAGMLAGFGCRVVGLSRHGRPAPGFSRVWGADAKEGFFAAAEHLILCLPSTKATKGLVGARELAALQGGLVVNVGRGD